MEKGITNSQMKAILNTRTETISKSEAVKLFEGVASNNYARIVRNYIQFLIDNDLEANYMTRNIFLQAVSESSAKVYKSAVNRFLDVCGEFNVLKVKEDTQLQKRQKLDHELNSYVRLFLAEADIRQSSKGTYQRALKEFVEYVEDGRGVSKKTVLDWREDLRQRLSAFTVNVYLSAVRQFAKFIIDDPDRIFKGQDEAMTGKIVKELTRITAVKNLKIEKDHYKDSFTREEVQRILDASDPHTRAIIGLLYYAGLRTVEVERLQTADVNMTKGVIMVMGKGKDQKTAVPMNDKLKELIRPFLVDGGQLFSGISTAMIRKSVNRVLNDLNMKEGDRKRSCHSFRHSYVQHLIQAGVDLHLVQRLARHASVNTTEIYFRKLQEAGQLNGLTNVL